MSNPRILVSITSYPARIKNVPMVIFSLLKKQTRTPDEIHLWLALPQFPNKEANLPPDLVAMSKANLVTIHWLEKDTVCHKRHEIFNQCQPNDCVFIVDDDTIYANNLIKTVMEVHEKYPNAIICYNTASKHLYKGKHILYPTSPIGGPYVNVGRINGNSMFPANVLPTEVYSVEYKNIRDKCTPICDESWITPWLVLYDVPIYWLQFGWGTEIDPVNIKMANGLVSQTHKIESNGLERRDNWLAAVLDEFPLIKQKYERLFNYGK